MFQDNFPGIRDDDPTATATQKIQAKQLRGGPNIPHRYYVEAEMIVFDNQLHLITHRGYFRFDSKTGEVKGHRFFRDVRVEGSPLEVTYNGRFLLRNNTLTAYAVMSRAAYIAEGHENDQFYDYHVMMSTDFGQTFTIISDNFRETLTYSYHPELLHSNPINHGWMGGTNPDRVIVFQEFEISANGILSITFNRTGAGNRRGVARTTDNGVTWDWLYDGMHGAFANFRQGVLTTFPDGLWPYPELIGSAGSMARKFGASKSNPDHMIMLDSYTAMRTTDGGRTWRDLSSRRMAGGPTMGRDNGARNPDSTTFFQTTGLEVTGLESLAINPFNKKHMYKAQVDLGINESHDGGKTWRVANWLPGTRWNVNGGGFSTAVAFDPHIEGIIPP
jgi:hypothetical protein